MNNKKTLLLGAGFTANFHTPVSTQVWNDLFNDQLIQKSKKIKETLLKYAENSDFETFYDEIMNGDFSDSEKSIVQDAIEHIFEAIDHICENATSGINPHGVNSHALFDFIQLFSGTKLGQGIIFTLNQDLFLERLYLKLRHVKKFIPISYPGPINLPFIENRLEIQTLPSEKGNGPLDWGLQINRSEQLNYVKLHGSYGWKSQQGTSKLVIGKTKDTQIDNEPLLHWYLDLFRKELSQKTDIWIIGYSFSDAHINNMLIDSIKNYDSSLFIIDIKGFNDFKKDIEKNMPQESIDFMNKLTGYYKCSLKEIFPKVGSLPSLERILSQKHATRYLTQISSSIGIKIEQLVEWMI